MTPTPSVLLVDADNISLGLPSERWAQIPWKVTR